MWVCQDMRPALLGVLRHKLYIRETSTLITPRALHSHGILLFMQVASRAIEIAKELAKETGGITGGAQEATTTAESQAGNGLGSTASEGQGSMAGARSIGDTGTARLPLATAGKELEPPAQGEEGAGLEQ